MRDALRLCDQYFARAEFGRLRGVGFWEPFSALEASVARYLTDFLTRDDRHC